MTSATSSPCPDCHGTLRELAVENLHLDRCDECRGVWFDAGELEDYRRRKGHDGRPSSVLTSFQEEAPRRPCPACATETLAERSVAGRPVLHCAGCGGLFLTAAELKALVAGKEDDWSWVSLSDAADLLTIPLEILEVVLGVFAA